jgi:hypothetical protein
MLLARQGISWKSFKAAHLILIYLFASSKYLNVGEKQPKHIQNIHDK